MKSNRRLISLVTISLALIISISLLMAACAGSTPAPSSPAPKTTPASSTTTSTAASKWTLPQRISIVTTTTTTTGYAAGLALLATVTDKTKVTFRLEPGSHSFERMSPLKDGSASFNLNAGADMGWLLNGGSQYNVKGWGPQPVQTVWLGGFMFGGFPVRADSGIKKATDIKGKRVAEYVGQEGMKTNTEGLIAFAGYTWDDVKRAPVGSLDAGMAGVVDGALDVAYSANTAKPMFELEASPHGIYWIPLPKSDTAAWARLHAVSPSWSPGLAEYGPGITKEKPVEMMGNCYHLISLPTQEENLTYWMTKQIAEGYATFKGKNPYLDSFTLDQTLNASALMAPYHPGSIRYFKEIGKWTEQNEKRNAELLAQQKKNRQDWEAAHPGW